MKRDCPLTDKQVLGGLLQDKDRDAWYLQGSDYCAWYYTLGRRWRPARLAEIGVRFGYSLRALVLGSRSAGQTVAEVFGWDDESYEPGCLRVVEQHLADVPLVLHRVNTRTLDRLGPVGLDLVHIDGDHSQEGCRHDLGLAWAALRPGGVLLVDDVAGIDPVWHAVCAFLREVALACTVLPTATGLAVIEKRSPLQGP
jgi:predicted O-methyltransferase YrrM